MCLFASGPSRILCFQPKDILEFGPNTSTHLKNISVESKSFLEGLVGDYVVPIDINALEIE